MVDFSTCTSEWHLFYIASKLCWTRSLREPVNFVSDLVDVIELSFHLKITYMFVLLEFPDLEMFILSSVIPRSHFWIVIFLPMNSSLLPKMTVVKVLLPFREVLHSQISSKFQMGAYFDWQVAAVSRFTNREKNYLWVHMLLRLSLQSFILDYRRAQICTTIEKA